MMLLIVILSLRVGDRSQNSPFLSKSSPGTGSGRKVPK